MKWVKLRHCAAAAHRLKLITEGEGKEDQKRTYDETRKEVLTRKEENPHRNKRESKEECEQDKKPFLGQCCVTEQEGREQVRQDVCTGCGTHFPIVLSSKHSNFTSNGFALGGELRVSHPTGGGRNSHSPAQVQWGTSDTIMEPPRKSVSRWSRVILQALDVHCTSYCSAVYSTWMWQRVIPSTVAVLWHLKPRIQVVFPTNDISGAPLHFPSSSV